MTENDRPRMDVSGSDDVEGHRRRFAGGADAERDEADDVEGHGRRFARDRERDEDLPDNPRS
jgi:hypothetical protein